MDIITLALAKKFATKVSAGYSKVEVDEATSSIFFTLNDGQKVSLKIPSPEAIKVTDIRIDANKHLIFTYSDGCVYDAGKLPGEGGSIDYLFEIVETLPDIKSANPDTIYLTLLNAQTNSYQTNLLMNGQWINFGKSEEEMERSVVEIFLNNPDLQNEIANNVSIWIDANKLASEQEVKDLFGLL